MKIILRGKKVILRPLSLKDAPRFCRWFADDDLNKLLSVYRQSPPTLKEEISWIKKIKQNKDSIYFCIDKINGEHIGGIILKNISKVHKTAELAVFIGEKKYWGQGYGTQACALMLSHGFKKLKLNRIYLSFVVYNVMAHKAYKKLGFKKEGVLRQNLYDGKHFHDEVVMGLLKNEYKKFKT